MKKVILTGIIAFTFVFPVATGSLPVFCAEIVRPDEPAKLVIEAHGYIRHVKERG